MTFIPRLSLAILVLASVPALAGDGPGFEPLFNGKDLTGWRLGPEVLDGKTRTSDGRFQVADGTIRIMGATRPDQPKTEAIDTVAPIGGSYILRLEFRASRNANSGLHLGDHEFKHQLQIRDYPRAGPYKSLNQYKEGGWNAVEVTVKPSSDGSGAVAHCTCNGEVLEEALPVPSMGPVGLQSETNLLEYRNLRVRRLD